MHFVFQFRQTACLHFLALTPSSDPYNPFGMKLMNSFKKLIKGVVCVADNKDWPSFRHKRGLVTIIGKQFCTSIPLQLVMQQNIGNLKQKKIELNMLNKLSKPLSFSNSNGVINLD